MPDVGYYYRQLSHGIHRKEFLLDMGCQDTGPAFPPMVRALFRPLGRRLPLRHGQPTVTSEPDFAIASGLPK